jgi:hypothetical protein
MTWQVLTALGVAVSRLDWLDSLYARFLHRAQFRSSFLFILGCIQVPYGVALLLSQRAHHPVHWWAGAKHSLDGIPVTWWGVVWVACGVTVLATCRRENDRIPFALSVMLNFTWASLALQTGFESPREEGAWGPGAVYLGISIGVLMISAWPDPLTVAHLDEQDPDGDPVP